MKKTLLFVIVFFSATFSSLQSAQSFFLEPSLNYQIGQGTLNSSNDSLDGFDTAVTGTGFGLKAGLSFLVPYVGIDLMYTHPSVEFDGGGLPEGQGTALWAGFVAGAKLPLLGLRAWASYLPYGAMTVDEDLVLSDGSALKFGAGYTFFPMLSVNVEYMMQTFKNVDDKSSGGVGDVSGAKFSNDAVIISLSIPI